MKLGILINGGIAALLAVPVVGYLISHLRGKAIVLGPSGPRGQRDPTIIQTVPKPGFLLWPHALLSLLPPQHPLHT